MPLAVLTCHMCVQSTPTVRDIHAKNCERFLNGMKQLSELIGMKINSEKIQTLCVTAAAGCKEISAHIRAGDTKIVSTPELKICSYRSGSRPDVSAQADI